MTTPTGHTSSSLFDFNDALQPNQSESSLEQNSSIEDSNIFVSVGGEMSSHTRFSSSALSGSGGLKSIGAKSVNGINDASLGPLDEELEEQQVESIPVVATAIEKNVAVNSTGGKGILKPSTYSEAGQAQRTQQQSSSQLMVDTESGIMSDDSMTFSSGFSGSPPSQPFSPTVHTSNQTPGGAQSPAAFSPTMHTSNQTRKWDTGDAVGTTHNHSNQNNNANYVYKRKADIVDRSVERVTVWVIYVALAFFCCLIMSCILLTFRVIHNYGFLTWVLVAFVIAFCGFLASFVDNTILSQNPNLRPVRQKIITVVRATRKALEDEYILFIRDWKENFLITQSGETSSQEDNRENLMGSDNSNGSGMLPSLPVPQQRRKKSKVFKMIRPFLGLKKNLFKGKRRRQKTQKSTDSNGNDRPGSIPSYAPPPV